ncbi:hypothetical protein BC826DRAFT_1137895 [Russula brevipes]|nr:hypothetical protein BC826DRAFT_1137895 [Russula brevipes]
MSLAPSLLAPWLPVLRRTRRMITNLGASGWYTEASPDNRMLLPLRSGIRSEIAWAFDRLCRLCNDERFLFCSIPGLTNAEELVKHRKAMSLILSALHNARPNSDENMEFLLYVADLFQYIAPTYILPPASALQTTSPLPPLLDLMRSTPNCSLIVCSLRCPHRPHLLFSNIANSPRLTVNSPTLSASLLYLPLYSDRVLVDVCIKYDYSHLSHPPMAKAFLLHTDMLSTLKQVG